MRARPRTSSSELIRLDLPTFERPRKAISGNGSGGQSDSWNALFKNSVVVAFILVGHRQNDQNWPRINADTRGLGGVPCSHCVVLIRVYLRSSAAVSVSGIACTIHYDSPIRRIRSINRGSSRRLFHFGSTFRKTIFGSRCSIPRSSQVKRLLPLAQPVVEHRDVIRRNETLL